MHVTCRHCENIIDVGEQRLAHGNEVQHVVVSPDTRRILSASSDQTARIWHVSPDPRPLDDLFLLTDLFSSTRGTIALSSETREGSSPREAWAALRARYAEQFACTSSEAAAWHRRAAEQCEAAGDWAAAIFHIDRLIAIEPRDESLRAKRALVQSKLNP
jgi:hypothetical protein